jgi:hypothetical protein
VEHLVLGILLGLGLRELRESLREDEEEVLAFRRIFYSRQ